MNPSYRHLARSYDDLFPLDPEALSLVLEILRGTEVLSVLDAGCGSGLLVRALADHGFRAHGFDLDPDLLAQAQVRSGGGASFSQGDLRTFVLPEGFPNPGLVVSLGNTLPHLTTETELEAFLHHVKKALSPGGQLLIQVLDYDFLAASNRLILPEKAVGNLIFRRSYEVQPTGMWRFSTSISSPEGVEANSFDLCPWGRLELEQALVRTGFRVEAVWGGFDQSPPGHSLPLVLLARVL